MLLFFELVYLAIGLVIYLYVHNRILSHLRGGMSKSLVQTGLLMIFLGLAMVLGILAILFPPQGAWLAFGILLLMGLGEVRHYLMRRQLRGAPPVELRPINTGFRHDPIQSGKLIDHLVTTLDLQLACYEVEVPALTGPGFSVLHLSDLHVSEDLPVEYYRQALEQVRILKPDLVFLTGDFVTDNDSVPLLSELLSTLQNPQPGVGAASPRLFALFGNHDYWSAPREVGQVLRKAGIELLQGAWNKIEICGSTILVGGDESPWGRKLSRCEEPGFEGPVLILSHTPDNIYRLIRDCRPVAVFSGHVHGGQLRFPLPWTLGSLIRKDAKILSMTNLEDRTTAVVIPSNYGRRFDHGHFVFPQEASPGSSQPTGQTHLFVSAGIGAGGPALRILCPPDMFLVRFKGAQSDGFSKSPAS